MNDSFDASDANKFIGQLHSQGVTIVDAMKQVMVRFGVSLGAAKQLVTAHVAWRGIVAAAEPLQGELEKIPDDSSPQGKLGKVRAPHSTRD